MLRLHVLLAIVVLLSISVRTTNGEIFKSPDGKVAFDLSADAGGIWFEIKLAAATVVERSRIGIQVEGRNIADNSELVRVTPKTANERYEMFGAHRRATNHFNGASVAFQSEALQRFFIEVRVFNDGAAFRHIIPGDGARTPDESTMFTLPEETVVWHHDLGGHYEDVHKRTLAEQLPAGEWLAPPITFRLKGGSYAAITEAALVNYSGMALQARGERRLQIGLGHKHPISYPFQLRYSNDVERVSKPYVVAGEIRSPWRVVMIGRDLNTLVNSDLVNNLSEPPDPKLFPEGARTSWIKPGRAVWKYLDGGANTFENMKEFSRWAGELGFEHHVIEGFWSRWSDGQIRELVEYSRQRGVAVWLWRHSRELRTPERQDAFFKKLQTNGVAGAKIDFFDHEHGEVVGLYTQLLRKAAEHKVLVNFHGANKPTGEARTWPNELIREGVRGMESSRLQQRAMHNTTLPFSRYLAGTGDYTPVHFGARKGDTTAAHQVATAVVFNEPLLTYAAHPTNLLRHSALPMIKSIPAHWDETIVLPGSEIGELVLMARRWGKQWFLVALNGPKQSRLNAPLAFLGGGKFRVLRLTDGENDRETIRLTEDLVVISEKEEVQLNLVPGGGYIARFDKESPQF